MNNHISQVDAEIRKELSRLIPTLKDPRIRGLVTVVRVETARDLSVCKVYVSAMDEPKDVLKGLRNASGFLRREISHALRLRHTPELSFIQDDSIRDGVRILSLINKAAAELPPETDDPGENTHD